MKFTIINNKIILAIVLFLILTLTAHAQAANYLSIKPKRDEGITNLLKRYLLPVDKDYVNKFIELNEGKLDSFGGLLFGRSYLMPVKIIRFDGKSIRSSLGIGDYDKAKEIEKYNDKLTAFGLKKSGIQKSGEIWVPMFDVLPFKPSVEKYAIFGKKYQDIKIVDKALEGNIYYLDPGHGGPDPGAVGHKDGHELDEDEYAYDVVLRLAKNLLEHGAEVYVIVQDPEDGIRDDKYLKNSSREFYFGGDSISPDQVERLRKRAEIINNLYEKNKSRARLQQVVVCHVDSRITDKRIDIFFYFNPGSAPGEKLANTLLNTIKSKYESAQPGRGYQGTVSSRNLYMLRETLPTAVYIELGNIQNPRDQVRLIEQNNRQAIANWLCKGLINAVSITE